MGNTKVHQGERTSTQKQRHVMDAITERAGTSNALLTNDLMRLSANAMETSRLLLCQELKRRSIIGVLSLYTENSTSPRLQEALSHAAPTWRAVLGYLSSRPMTWEQSRLAVRDFYECHPSAECQIRNTSANINLRKGTALVYLEFVMEGTSAMADIKLHGIGTCGWKKDDEGAWMCHKYWSMRNISGNEGFV